MNLSDCIQNRYYMPFLALINQIAQQWQRGQPPPSLTELSRELTAIEKTRSCLQDLLTELDQLIPWYKTVIDTGTSVKFKVENQKLKAVQSNLGTLLLRIPPLEERIRILLDKKMAAELAACSPESSHDSIRTSEDI